MEKSVTKNLGTFIIGASVILIGVILTGILIKFQQSHPMIEKIVNILKQKIFFNSVLRTAMQSYFKIALIGFFSI